MQEGITASDVASANEFWDLCAVIELMEPQATADITEVSLLKLWQRVSLISKMFMFSRLGTWYPTLLCATVLFVLGGGWGVEGDFWFSIFCG